MIAQDILSRTLATNSLRVPVAPFPAPSKPSHPAKPLVSGQGLVGCPSWLQSGAVNRWRAAKGLPALVALCAIALLASPSRSLAWGSSSGSAGLSGSHGSALGSAYSGFGSRTGQTAKPAKQAKPVKPASKGHSPTVSKSPAKAGKAPGKPSQLRHFPHSLSPLTPSP